MTSLITRKSNGVAPKLAPIFPLRSMQRDIDQLFDAFFDTPLGTSSVRNDMASCQLDVSETDEAYHVAADLPGVNDDDLTLEMNDDVLSISATREAHDEKKEHHYHRIERRFGQFNRSIQLPENVKEDKIEARFSNGVLEITIPKAEPKKSKSRKISIKK